MIDPLGEVLEIKNKDVNKTFDPSTDSLEAQVDNFLTPIKAKTDGLPTTPADQATLADIKAQTDKLAGEAPVTGSATQDWQAAESDVVAIGSAGVSNKIHDLTLSIHNLVGTSITVRLYKQVNGIERCVYQQTFDATSDPSGLPIINGTWALHGVLRATLQSNNAADDGKAVDYDFMLEAM
jgi:hypothetical protein